MIGMTNLFIGGIPLIAVIFGLIEAFKSWGLKGNWLSITSLLLGLIFGMAYKYSLIGIPTTFGGWFESLIFGLALGLITSGFYDFADSRFPTAPGSSGSKAP